MDKMNFSAVYQGECYIKGYGRKFYKKGIRLADIKDNQKCLIAKQIDTNLSKAFTNYKELEYGNQIKFKAILTEDNKLLYISNVEIIREWGINKMSNNDKYIVIKVVAKQPDEQKFWSYPVEEISYIFEQIEEGCRENGYKFYLFNNRLYETEETRY